MRNCRTTRIAFSTTYICAIYMADEDNTYGHPHPETIQALEDIGAEIYGTDVCGTITVTTDGSEYTISGCTP